VADTGAIIHRRQSGLPDFGRLVRTEHVESEGELLSDGATHVLE
jgi:hypothetical protein